MTGTQVYNSQKEPGAGHQALMQELHGVCGRALLSGVTEIEQIAVLAQKIGQMTAKLPGNQYSSGELMACVAQNIVAGNDGGAPVILDRARPLNG